MAALQAIGDMNSNKIEDNDTSKDPIQTKSSSESLDNSEKDNTDKSECTEIIETSYLHDNFAQHLSIPLTEDEDKLSRLLAERTIKANEHSDRHVYIHEKLPEVGRCYKSMTRVLESMMTPENSSGKISDLDFMKNQLQDLDYIGQCSLISQALVTYVSTVDPHVFKKFGERVFGDISYWSNQLVKMDDSSVYLHDDHINGLVCVTRLALHRKFPKYASEGFKTLLSRPPVIYVGPATKSTVSQYICTQLGLPLSSVREVRVDDINAQTMDVTLLRKMVDQDVADGLTPILLLAFAGTHMMGKIDELVDIQKICMERDMWMHCEGSALSLLLQENVPEIMKPALKSNSLTLNLSMWLGVPGLPFMTIYQKQDPVMTQNSSLSAPGHHFYKRCVPIWCCFQGLGLRGIRERTYAPIILARSMYQRLNNIGSIRMINDLTDHMATMLIRYENTTGAKKSGSSNRVLQANDPYFNALNIWLVDIMRRDRPCVLTHSICIDNIGFCIRYSPLEHANAKSTNLDDVTDWVNHFNHQIKILNATVNQKLDFEDIVLAQDSLKLLRLPSWAGLGAIQYVPEHLIERYDNLDEHEKMELNEVNIKLVEKLKSSDGAFSLGETENGEICARFGLITSETDFEELIGLVYTTGKRVEESSKFLESMGDVIKEGIERVETDLMTEEQYRLANEGVMRQIPGVGSVFNWFSPPPKEIKRGRTFDLTSGVIESTEKTYELKIQVQHVTFNGMPSDNTPESLKSALKPRLSAEDRQLLMQEKQVSQTEDEVFEEKA